MTRKTKTKCLPAAILSILYLVLFSGCNKDFNGYYNTPENLKGPIYEQLKSDPDFSEFVAAIDKFPRLAKDINTSGLFTVFAPTNEAIKTYLSAKYPGKNSIADFDIKVEADSLALNALVQMHIIFNMYFDYDFNKAVDILSKPDPLGAFYSNDVWRYTTKYKDPRYWYYDKTYKKNRLIEPNYKKVTVYSKNYLDKYSLRADYQTFFGTEPTDFNVDLAQIILPKKDIAAKNGVIHGINKVLERLPFMDELIKQKNPEFYNLLDQFALLTATSVDKITKDTLFVKLYYTQRYLLALNLDDVEYTALCPSGNSFLDFINNKVLPGFDNSYDSIHPFTSSLILSSYLISSYANSANLQKLALNGAGDTLKNLVFSEKSRASNGVLYTVSNEVLSPAFKSVAKVPLLNKKYSWFLNLLTTRFVNGLPQINYDNINYLKNQYRSFTLIIPSNSAFIDQGISYQTDYRGNRDFFQNGSRLLQSQKDSIVNSLIIPNQSIEPGSMTYKWAATRGNNYMLFKNGKIQGTVDYLTSELTGNGYAYTTEELPSRPNTSLASIIGGRPGYSIFIDSILNVQRWSYSASNSQTFMSLLNTIDGINSYTVLIPSDAVLNQYKSDHGLGYFTKDSTWRKIAAYHIIKTRIFGDGTFERLPGNPLVDDDSKFITLYPKDVYGSVFIKDVNAWVQMNFTGGLKTITSEGGLQANIIYPFDIQAANGVMHAVDKILMPPARQFH